MPMEAAVKGRYMIPVNIVTFLVQDLSHLLYVTIEGSTSNAFCSSFYHLYIIFTTCCIDTNYLRQLLDFEVTLAQPWSKHETE